MSFGRAGYKPVMRKSIISLTGALMALGACHATVVSSTVRPVTRSPLPGASSASATALPVTNVTVAGSAKPLDLKASLLKPPAVPYRTLTGTVQIDPDFLVAKAGGVILSDNGGAFSAPNGGSVISENGAGVLVDGGGGLVAGNGGRLASRRSGGLSFPTPIWHSSAASNSSRRAFTPSEPIEGTADMSSTMSPR